MKWLIALLTAATGVLHLLIGFNILGGGPTTNWMLVLNGAGYLVLLFLYLTASGSRRGTLRWIMIAYALITIVGYFVINGTGGLQYTLGMVVKAIELLLVILLFMDRGSEPAVVPATRTSTYSAPSSTVSRTAGQVDTTTTATAAGIGSAAAGLGTAPAAMAAAAMATADEAIVSPAEEVAEDTGGILSDATDWVGDKVDDAGDAMADAGEAVVEAGGDAADWVGDKVDDAGDAMADAGDAVVDAGGDAADWVGDKVDDAGDAMADAGEAVVDAGGDAADWVGDKVDDAGDAMADAGEAVVDARDDAVDWVGDKVEEASGPVDMSEAFDDVADRQGSAPADWASVGQVTTGEMAAGMVAAAPDDADTRLSASDAEALDQAQLAAEPSADELRGELEEYLRSFGSGSEFRKGVEYVEGIGAGYAERLRAAGIATVFDLMVNGATRRGRKHIADQTGLAQSLILTWVNHIDLFRIKGVAEEYADLLEQSGVDTVVELAQRNPTNLLKKMTEINEQRELVRRLPRQADVLDWVAQAKSLKRLVHY